MKTKIKNLFDLQLTPEKPMLDITISMPSIDNKLKTVKEIADELTCSARTVRRFINEKGLEAQQSKGIRFYQKSQLKELYEKYGNIKNIINRPAEKEIKTNGNYVYISNVEVAKAYFGFRDSLSNEEFIFYAKAFGVLNEEEIFKIPINLFESNKPSVDNLLKSINKFLK